jgi:cytochrome P450
MQQESLRKYSVVPVVTRRVASDDSICGRRVPAGTYLACCLQAVHSTWQRPEAWLPERFLPGGEYDRFPEDIRPFMVSAVPTHPAYQHMVLSGYEQQQHLQKGRERASCTIIHVSRIKLTCWEGH